MSHYTGPNPAAIKFVENVPDEFAEMCRISNGILYLHIWVPGPDSEKRFADTTDRDAQVDRYLVETFFKSLASHENPFCMLCDTRFHIAAPSLEPPPLVNPNIYPVAIAILRPDLDVGKKHREMPAIISGICDDCAGRHPDLYQTLALFYGRYYLDGVRLIDRSTHEPGHA
jgi:hypothetical protein